jgi:hypothetical protein
LFNELQENVAELVSRPAGSYPGSMDQSIPGSHIEQTQLDVSELRKIFREQAA